ncbi:MAG TPA: winged helix-turn-helix domain-containing protein [Terracidiphilus sp.]|jgi:Tol biopolymer transport system component/DNA-binding winged helix-turn-helix (wHTH) protein
MAAKSLVFKFADVEVREREFCVVRNGQSFAVEPKAFRVLLMLLRNPKKLISKVELLDTIWGDAAVTENSLTRSVALLRRVLEDDAHDPRFIETVATVGYRFLFPVEMLEDPSADIALPQHADITVSAQNETPIAGTAAAAISVGSAQQSSGDPVRAMGSHGKPGRGKIWLAIGAAVVLGTAALVWELSRSPAPPHVTNVAQITNDGHQKLSYVTDGVRLYYSVQVGPEVKFYQVSSQGGEPVQMNQLDGMSPLDISADRTKLLLNNNRDNTVWVASVLGGTPSRLGDLIAGDASWSPNGDRIAYAAPPNDPHENELWVAESNGSGAHKLLTGSNLIYSVRWSPDGRAIRFSVYGETGSNMAEVSPDGTGQHRIFPDWTRTAYVSGRWTPDARYFVFAKSFEQSWGRMDIWALRESGRLSHVDPVRLTMGPLWANYPQPSPDGKRIYFLGWVDRGELVRYDTRTDQWLPYLSGLAATHVDFSRDGKWVVYNSYPEAGLWRSALDGSHKLQLITSSLQAMNPRWSPDGTQIAFAARGSGEPWRIYVESAEGGGLRELASGECVNGKGDPTWSSDGAYLLFNCSLGNGSSPLSKVDMRSGHVSVLPGTQGLWSPRWSPDGQYVAALSFADPSKVVLYDFKTHEQRVVFAPQGGAGWPTWSNDSLFVYATGNSGAEEYRVRIKDGKAEVVADLTKLSFAPTDPNFGWVGLGPDGSLLATRNAGTNTEIYALDWDER